MAAGTAAVGVVGGVLGSNAAKKAAKQQQKASQAAQQVQTTQHDNSVGALSPYTTAGANAEGLLTQGIGSTGTNGDLTRSFTNADFVADPGYQFRLQQGANTVQGSAAAQGGALSGAAQKALAQYGQGFASNEFSKASDRFVAAQNNAYNKIAGVATNGLNATNSLVNANTQYGDQTGNLITGAGNAAAAGTVGSANALVGGLNSAVNSYQQGNYLNQLQTANANRASGYSGGNIGLVGRAGTGATNYDDFLAKTT